MAKQETLRKLGYHWQTVRIMQWRGWPLNALLHVCCHAEFGRSTSKDVAISRGSAKTGERWASPRSFGTVLGGPLRNHTHSHAYRAEYVRSRSHGMSVITDRDRRKSLIPRVSHFNWNRHKSTVWPTYDFLLTFHINHGLSRAFSEINGDLTWNFPIPVCLMQRGGGSLKMGNSIGLK